MTYPFHFCQFGNWTGSGSVTPPNNNCNPVIPGLPLVSGAPGAPPPTREPPTGCRLPARLARAALVQVGLANALPFHPSSPAPQPRCPAPAPSRRPSTCPWLGPTTGAALRAPSTLRCAAPAGLAMRAAAPHVSRLRPSGAGGMRVACGGGAGAACRQRVAGCERSRRELITCLPAFCPSLASPCPARRRLWPRAVPGPGRRRAGHCGAQRAAAEAVQLVPRLQRGRALRLRPRLHPVRLQAVPALQVRARQPAPQRPPAEQTVPELGWSPGGVRAYGHSLPTLEARPPCSAGYLPTGDHGACEAICWIPNCADCWDASHCRRCRRVCAERDRLARPHTGVVHLDLPSAGARPQTCGPGLRCSRRPAN